MHFRTFVCPRYLEDNGQAQQRCVHTVYLCTRLTDVLVQPSLMVISIRTGNVVRTWFDQPGHKLRRRQARKTKAATLGVRPLKPLRLAMRAPTVRYNTKLREGRGFMGWMNDDESAVGSSYDSWWTGTGKCRGDAIAVGWGRLVCEISSLPGHFTHFQGLRH